MNKMQDKFYLVISISYTVLKNIFFHKLSSLLFYEFVIIFLRYTLMLDLMDLIMKVLRLYIVFLCFFCAFCLGRSAAAYAAEMPNAIQSDGTLTSNEGLPWKIYADSLVSVNDGVVIEGRGNILLVRGEDYLKADFARLYTNTQWILLQGNVYAKLGADEVEAAEAEFDLTNSTGWLKDAKLFLAGPHMYFKSDEIYKKGEARYSLVKATATTCDGDVPLWKIDAKEADLEVDSYAHFYDVVFNVKNHGLLYTPYFVAPTKTTRQSGLLLPNYGYSSAQGYYYTQPYFHVIDQSRDLTVYGTVLTEKGFMPSLEYRSHTKENEKMWAMLDFLYDDTRVMHEGQDDVDKYDGNIRSNRTRYWLRAMGNGDVFESDWKYKYNLDYVSDQNFIREFSSRMTGFDYTKENSYHMFGRNFTEADENRITQGFAYRNFEKFYLTAGMKYTQDPRFGHGNLSHKNDTTVQHLPELGLYWNRDRLSEDLPVEWNLQSSAGYYYRRSGTKGAKAEIYPELVFPVSVGFLRGEIAGRGRGTLYTGISGQKTSFISEQGERERQRNNTRLIPEFRSSFYAQADRVWQLGEKNTPIPANVGKREIVAVKHSIQPRISYEWTDYVDQEDNPFFTLEDRIQEQNNLVFRLDNILTTKNSHTVQEKDGIKNVSSYLDLIRLQISTGYDFKEDGRIKHLEQFERRPWHDLRTRLVFMPQKWIHFNGDVFYSFYDDKLNRVDIGSTLYHEKYGSFSTSYSQREPNYNYRKFVDYDNIDDIIPSQKINVITNTLHFTPCPEFRIYLMDRLNLDTGENYERALGIGYKHQCLYVYTEYTKDPIEERVSLNIEFLGLGF